MMKKYILIMLFTLAGLAGMAQTNEPLPGDAEPLTNQLYLSPSDSTVWAADPFSGLAIKVGTWFKVDSLFKEGYTKAQVDSAIAASTAFVKNTKTYSASNFHTTTGRTRDSLKAGIRYSGNGFSPLDSVYFFGDSYTLGTGASPSTNRYSTRASTVMNVSERNFGIGSSLMQSTTPPRPLSARSMQDTLEAIPIKGNRQKALVIEYGLNDVGSNQPDYDTVKFKAAYRTVLNTAQSRGWSMSEILIVSPAWIPDAGLTYYSMFNGGMGTPTRQRLLDYVAACAALAAEKGTMYLDAYDLFLSNGAGTLLAADSLHPNNAGHLLLGNRVSAVIKAGLSAGPNYSLSADSSYVTVNGLLRFDNPNSSITNTTGNFIINRQIGAFTNEVAIIDDDFDYLSGRYWGGHMVTRNNRLAFESVGRGGERAKSITFGINNPGSAKRFMELDTLDGGLMLDSGLIRLNGDVRNLLLYRNTGLGFPTFNSRSAGTKITLFPNVGASTVDYALGVASNTLWFSLPASNGLRGWRFYAGTTQVAEIRDDGVITGLQYRLSALNTPPASATATGTAGEIRFGTDGRIYICTATNTWIRSEPLTTW